MQKQAANCDDFTERKKYEIEAAEIAREISENRVPIAPLFIVDDVTPEALGIHMAENNERMAVMSAEGGIFDIMAGRYNDKGCNLDLYLKAHSGDPWSSHRVGRGEDYAITGLDHVPNSSAGSNKRNRRE